jgi:hypothetical protein
VGARLENPDQLISDSQLCLDSKILVSISSIVQPSARLQKKQQARGWLARNSPAIPTIKAATIKIKPLIPNALEKPMNRSLT